MPHLDEKEFPRKIEEDVGVIGVITSIGDGQVKGDVLDSSEGQVGPSVDSVRKDRLPDSVKEVQNREHAIFCKDKLPSYTHSESKYNTQSS